MSRINIYPNMQAILRDSPRVVSRRSELPKNAHLNREPLIDRGLEAKYRPRPESAVFHFDPPAGFKGSNPFPPELFVPGRTIFMAGVITDELGKVVSGEIIKRGISDPVAPILLWIDSPGGSVEAGLAIREAILSVKPKVSTISLGAVSSMAAFLASFGGTGKRFALDSTTFMYHEVRFGSDLAGGAEEILEGARSLTATTEALLALLARASGNEVSDLSEAIRRSDRFFGAVEANRIGFIDGVFRHIRYSDTANPQGLKIKQFQRNHLERAIDKDLQLGEKVATSGKPLTVNLKGFLDGMQSYKIIARLLAYASLFPQKDIRLKIRNSPGGLVEEGLGVFDVMRLINSLPATGSVNTFGCGREVGGISALLLAAGKLGSREIQSQTQLVLKDIGAYVPAYASATEVKETSEEAVRVKEMLLKRLDKHSNRSAGGLRSAIAKGKGKLILDAPKAVEAQFADKLSESGPRKKT